MLGYDVPALVDDLEGDVFVRRARREANDAVVGIALGVLLEGVSGRLGRVDEVRVEEVELVALRVREGGRRARKVRMREKSADRKRNTRSKNTH